MTAMTKAQLEERLEEAEDFSQSFAESAIMATEKWIEVQKQLANVNRCRWQVH